jgi:UDP-N-acetylglucosamine 2-epimerase (non-hydrolysing)
MTGGNGRLVLHVVGARPNFPKMSPVHRALASLGVPQVIVHTGQHYDAAMSAAFFSDLALPDPQYNLGIGAGTHARQTGALLPPMEDLLVELQPELVLVYGDVNSTLAAALVAAKLQLTVAHVEAGLRSGDMSMPEEVNRKLVDAVSGMLFATSPDAIANLAREGVAPQRIHFVGNPMIDSLAATLGDHPGRVDRPLPRADGSRYAVATVHRPANVDKPEQARNIVDLLRDLSAQLPTVLPLHPRGRAMLEAFGVGDVAGLAIVDPMAYRQFVNLIAGATLVVTDSGGIQEETTYLKVPCITIRPNTERPITITHGTNQLATTDSARPLIRQAVSGKWSIPPEPPPLWDGRAGERIAAVISAFLHTSGPDPATVVSTGVPAG